MYVIYLIFPFLLVVCIAECERWKRTDNISAENGEFYPLTSIAACMDLCLSKSSCVAVDIWSDTCALHLNASNLESNRVTNRVSQFVLDRSCAVSTESTVAKSTPISGSLRCMFMSVLQRVMLSPVYTSNMSNVASTCRMLQVACCFDILLVWTGL